MKLNTQHSAQYKKEFAALKWCLNNAKLNVNDKDYTGYIFEGRLPYYQIQHLITLKKLGYQHPGDSEILNMSWLVGNNYHGVAVNFRNKSIKVTHQAYALTESELAQYQAD
jgi:hypothetical protein